MKIDIDIIVYAVIAVLLLGRLWYVLGTRHDDEPQRPNPFTPPAPKPVPATAALPSPQALPRLQAFAGPPPASLEGGLAQVKTIDPLFDEKRFLQDARDAFTIIVGAYAANKLDSVAEFLSPDLRAHFQKAADARTAAGQTAQTRVARITETEVTAARAEAGRAFVTVQIVSAQENILRDARGAIIGGAEGALEEVTDIWVFAKDAATPGAKWIVVETKG